MSEKLTCRASECDKEVHAKGYCERHYAQWRRGKLPKPRYRSCNAEGCRKPRSRRGLCEEHFAKEYPGKPAKVVEAVDSTGRSDANGSAAPTRKEEQPKEGGEPAATES